MRVFFAEVTIQNILYLPDIWQLTATFITGSGLLSMCVKCVNLTTNDEWDKKSTLNVNM